MSMQSVMHGLLTTNKETFPLDFFKFTTSIAQVESFKHIMFYKNQNYAVSHSNFQRTLDFLKIDIEFNEWDSFDAIYKHGSLKRVKQFAFEIHTHELNRGAPTTIAQFVKFYEILKHLENLGFRKWLHHMNPYGMYKSRRTGKNLSCCYELYYINTKYMADFSS